jgi:hypothetical protein
MARVKWCKRNATIGSNPVAWISLGRLATEGTLVRFIDPHLIWTSKLVHNGSSAVESNVERSFFRRNDIETPIMIGYCVDIHC